MVAAVSVSLPDHFSLFGLEPRFGLDNDHLIRAYRTVQAHVHPDRYAGAGAAEQRAALQWATLANEAYQVLNSPVRRAAYLCELHDVEVSGESGRFPKCREPKMFDAENTLSFHEFAVEFFQW